MMSNTAAFLVFAACAAPVLRCQELYEHPWRAPTIFLAEIEQVNADGPNSEPRLPAIRARAVRVIRDDLHQGLQPGEFTAPPPPPPPPPESMGS